MAAAAEELVARVRGLLGGDVLDAHTHRGDATVLVPVGRARECLQRLRDEPGFQFNVLVDVTAVDYLGREPRFELVYHLASFDLAPAAGEPCAVRARLRVKTGVHSQAAEADSVTSLWDAANWYEREVWDLYGIQFRGHPDLRRILLYDEFQGHPLRKDYPKERRQPLVGPKN
ncbi:MAG TPA: NADH-quinone oxidoreductase subunit C [Myxococcota bacterium]|nr:NADH-quinone oxidoreductase subunit C [Myxococcota bacterium]